MNWINNYGKTMVQDHVKCYRGVEPRVLLLKVINNRILNKLYKKLKQNCASTQNEMGDLDIAVLNIWTLLIIL
jgi:hypothetical protein